MLKYDNYYIPKTLKEYAKMCNGIGNYRIVAGCTDTMPWAREGRAGDVYFKNIIDVSKIKELNYMKFAK
jgi:xanthine dehydrogenase FAD-binding subunit